MPDDLTLLRQYAQTREAEAFAELVRRYAGMVYGSCLRVTRDRDDAEDVAQECFMELARKAGAITSCVAGWLHTTATRRAMNAVRGANRRRRHEEQAMEQNGDADTLSWDEIAPHVDQALEEIPDDQRTCLVRHFLRGQSQTEIARELGMSQPTVSRRIEVGLKELREKLGNAGIVAPVAVVGTLLTENAAAAAPATLVEALGKMAMAGVGSSAAAATVSTTGGKLATVVAVSLLAAAGAVTYQQATKPEPTRPPASQRPRPTPKPKKEEAMPKKVDNSARLLTGDRWGQDSFSLTMQAVARQFGREADYETIYALSTNGFAPDIAPEYPCRASWRLLGRERCVDTVAGYLGLQALMEESELSGPILRFPEVVKDLIAYVTRHHLDSGAVVIGVSLSDDWRCPWGIVREVHPDGRIVGTVVDGRRNTTLGELAPLCAVTPGEQRLTQEQADREMLRRAVARIHGDREPFLSDEVVFGLKAMDLWVAQMCKPAFQEDDPSRSAMNAHRNALITCSGARTVASYLRKRAEVSFGKIAGPYVEATAVHYERIASLLDPFAAWDPPDRGAGYQLIMGDVDNQKAHAEQVLKPVRAELAATAVKMELALAEERLRPLRYSVRPEVLCDPRYVDALDVKVTELLGSSPSVGRGELFVARGEYELKEPGLAWLMLSGMGEVQGRVSPLSLGKGTFETTAGMLRVVPGQARTLDLRVGPEDRTDLAVRSRLELEQAGPAQGDPDGTDRQAPTEADGATRDE